MQSEPLELRFSSSIHRMPNLDCSIWLRLAVECVTDTDSYRRNGNSSDELREVSLSNFEDSFSISEFFVHTKEIIIDAPSFLHMSIGNRPNASALWE